MASDGIQPGQEDAPAFSSGGALSTGPDMEELARYAKKRGNVLKGTTTAMNEFTEYAQEGVLWSNTTDDNLHRFDGTSWVPLFGLPLDAVNPPVAAGWTTPVSQNALTRRSGVAYYTFNAIRSASASAGAVITTIPAGYRSGLNVYGQAWGLSSATPAVQVSYDAATNQIRLGQALAIGQAVALTLSWPITG